MKQKIVALISALVPKAKIYLFGSRARGTHSPGSDIDIALDAGEQLPFSLVGEVRSILEATNILYKIEVVDFHSVSDDMRASILDEGILWKNTHTGCCESQRNNASIEERTSF